MVKTATRLCGTFTVVAEGAVAVSKHTGNYCTQPTLQGEHRGTQSNADSKAGSGRGRGCLTEPFVTFPAQVEECAL